MQVGQGHSAPAWLPAAWRAEVRLGGGGDKGCWHSEAGTKPVLDKAGRCHCQSFSFMTKADGRRVCLGWLMVEAQPQRC